MKKRRARRRIEKSSAPKRLVQKKPVLDTSAKEFALSAGLIDMVGQRFGRLVVTEYAGKRRKDQTGALWKCKCDCGGEKLVPRRSLINGTTKSCGCLAAEIPASFIGERFGSLVVVEYAGKNHRPRGGSLWNCKCDCGGSKQASGECLRRGQATNCGCKYDRNAVHSPRVRVENVKLLDAAPKFRACEAGVYFLFVGVEIIYIGQSRNIFERVGRHARHRRIPFDGWDFVAMDDPSVRYAVEQELIRQHSPRYNRAKPDFAQAA